MQARQPSFYSVAKVSDSVDGRFELIVLHLFILLHCFRHDPITASISQDLVNAMTEDMDRALRQLGVGDLKIGREVRTMAATMQVRLRSYEVALEGEDEILIERLSNRRTCGSCGAITNLLNSPSREEGKCDQCSGELIQRDDDQPNVIRERLKVYKRQTEPLIAYYAKRDQLIRINGVGTIEEVTARILENLPKEE